MKNLPWMIPIYDDGAAAADGLSSSWMNECNIIIDPRTFIIIFLLFSPQQQQKPFLFQKGKFLWKFPISKEGMTNLPWKFPIQGSRSYGAFTHVVKSVLNENLGGILGGTQC
jgi:type IV secretory pathway VirB6-like protein